MQQSTGFQQIKVLTCTTLYPNDNRPRHGIFVENRLRQFSSRTDAEVRVIAPVAWMPFKSQRLGHWSVDGAAKISEQRHGIMVEHPRYFAIPKLFKFIVPFTLGWSFIMTARRLRKNGFDFDLIDAHYFYPDGAAAALASIFLNRPLTVTARGSDINHFPKEALPRRWIQWTLSKAFCSFAVSRALRIKLEKLGDKNKPVVVLRNGVDLDLFTPPSNRMLLRESLGWDRKTVLSVGNLVPLKGFDLLIEAVAQLPEIHLCIVGDGPSQSDLKTLTEKLKISERVSFLPVQPQNSLVRLYQAADVFVLASSSEGFANVLVESLACGTPVVATRVGGNAEIVSAECSGLLVDRSVDAIKSGIERMMQSLTDRTMIRKAAEEFDWDSVCHEWWASISKLTDKKIS